MTNFLIHEYYGGNYRLTLTLSTVISIASALPSKWVKVDSNVWKRHERAFFRRIIIHDAVIMGSPSLSLDLSFGARVDVDISCSVPTLVISHPHSSHSESADEVLENKTLKPLPAAPIALIHLQSSPSLLYCPSASALPLAFRRFPVKGPKVRRQGFLCVCADASLHIFYLDDSLAWKSLSTSLVSTEGSSEQPFLDDSMDGSATAIAYTTSPPDVPIDSCAVQLDENNIVLVAIKEKLGLVVYTVQITISDSSAYFQLVRALVYRPLISGTADMGGP